MPHSDWEKVKHIFHEVLRRDSSERERYLDDACQNDPELRDEVQTLIQSLNDATTFLETPVVGTDPSVQNWQLQNGQTVSNYKIIEPIGAGGMGEVYLAEDIKLGRRVALKVLPADVANQRNRLQRFQREANAVSALNHPNILTIFDFGEAGGIQFFVSEFVGGRTLRDRLDEGRLPLTEALEIAIQIVSALQAAHQEGVIHRDIKPENVMIRDDGIIKVLDFGLAKVSDSSEAVMSGANFVSQNLSTPGLVMGTAAYMSPEQTRGSSIDMRSDLFSFGVVMYEMLSGIQPFAGDTTADVIARLIQIDPTKLRELRADVPADLEKIVNKTLAKDRAERFSNASDLVAALKRVLKRVEFDTELKRFQSSDPEVVRSRSDDDRRQSSERIRMYLPDLSKLVGREKEIAEITRLLTVENARLVTLTGIGGTGKTRLAQELCVKLQDEFADGFVFVRLADVHDPRIVPAIIAQHARIQEIVGKPILESLKEYLEDRDLLLVLDNFEQIMDASPAVSELLNSSERLRILVTSRERLHLSSEAEYNVLPLTVPEEECDGGLDELAKIDSVRLFVERAQKANSDFQLTEENASQIAKICSMLDGLPLAIELAAARTRIFSPEIILEKLTARLAFLTGGARDLPERQQTMRAAVDWSYDLLNDDERRLFRRLSVFSGRFTLEGADEIGCDRDVDYGEKTPPEFFDIFASLADKSLIVRRKNRRGDITYCLLEIVREYAQTVLERDDNADEIRRRHAALYLEIAETAEPHLRGPESAAWVKSLDEDHDNITAAILWSLEKDPLIAARLIAAVRQFWLTRGYFSEGLRWAEAVLAKGAEMPPEIRWKILTLCGNINQFQGERLKASEYYQQGLADARLSGNQAVIAQSLRGLSAMSYIDLDLERAREFASEAIEISRASADEFGLAAALARLGDISSIERDFEAAAELTTESLDIFRRLGYLEGISAKLYNLGAVVFLAGDHELARKHFLEAFDVARDLGEKINTRLIFDGFAALAAEDGNFALAAKLSGVAQSLGATIGYAIEPAERLFRDAYIEKVTSQLTDDEFDAEYRLGQKLSIAEAFKLVSR